MNEIAVKRTTWIDISKGIAIILMVLGHTSLPMALNSFIFAFHMPLFFIASGWTTNWQKNTIWEFIEKRTRSLIIPFVIYSAIILFIHVLYGWMTPLEWVQKGWGDGYPLWFIPVLYFASIIARCVYHVREYKNSLFFWLFVILLLFAGIDLSHSHIRLPWALSTIPFATFLIILGTEWKQLYETTTHRNNLLFGVVVMFLIVLGVSSMWRLDLCFNRILPALPLTIGAIAGTYMVFVLSRVLDGNNGTVTNRISKLLQSIGRETYIVVAFSTAIIMLINYYVCINPIIKYLVLIIIMIVICWLKKRVVWLWETILKRIHINKTLS